MVFAIIYCAIAALIGIVLCFFGYRYLKKLFIGIGFLIGAFTSYLLLAPVLSPVLAVVASIAIGLAVGFLLYFLYIVGIFLMGAGFGALIVLLICMLAGFDYTGLVPIIIMSVAAIAMGVLAVIHRRGIMVISTAFLGSSMAVLYIGFLFSSIPPSLTMSTLTNSISSFYSANSFTLTAATIGIGIAGMLIQFIVTAPGKRSNKK